MNIIDGIPDDQHDQAIDLYWRAFGDKLNFVMRPESKARALIARVLDPAHAISALDSDGRLIGIAGFKTYRGAMVGGGFRDLWAVYGVSSLWRAALIALLERDVENKRFLMDGICVDPKARGMGVGTALLAKLYDIAKTGGYSEIRLDVIDTNPRARALYEREGFKAIGEERLGPLSKVFGFESATKMVRTL